MSRTKFTILSGGQSGVDQAALRAARACGLPTGGFAPRGWLTEDGPAPWLAEYGLDEVPPPDPGNPTGTPVGIASSGYRRRTILNVSLCDALLWLGNPHSPGGRLTLTEAGRKAGKNLLLRGLSYIDIGLSGRAGLSLWLPKLIGRFPEGCKLLVAGNRESSCPGIGRRAEDYLTAAFREVA
jgi:hypothetical protein